MRRTTITLVLATLIALPCANAQRPRFPQQYGSSPKWWASLWGGYQWSHPVADGGTGSIWRFDSNWQYRLTLEREFSSHAALGVAFNYSRMPLAYVSAIGNSGNAACTACNADATIASYGVLGRVGGGPGFHQILEAFLGAMQFSKFEELSPRQSLPPTAGNTDFAFAIAYGFGYSLANDWQIGVVQEYANNVHERATQILGANRVSQHLTLRLGVRVGF